MPSLAQIRFQEAMRRLLEAGVSGGVFPGGVAATSIYRDGAHLLSEGFAGSLSYESNSARVRSDTIYDLASITKSFVAVAALVAADRGEIELDRPAEDVLADLRGGVAADVTLRQLLSHRSGLSAWGGLFLDLPHALGSPAARRWIVAEAARRRECPADQRTQYSDLGYIVAGAMIAAMAGAPLDRVVAENVTGPLGIRQEVFYIGGSGAPSRTIVSRRIAPTERCDFRGRIIRAEVHDENAAAMGGVSGHAGLFGTARGVAVFARAILDVLADRSDVFPREALIGALMPQADSTYRLGFDGKSESGSSAGSRMDPSAFGHLGFTGTSFWCDPRRDLAIVLLTNRVHPSRANKRITGFRPAFHDGLVGVHDALFERKASNA